MIQQFKIRPNGFAEIRKKMLIRVIPVMLIAAMGGGLISQINYQGKSGDVNILPFFIPFIVIVMGISIFRAISRQKKVYDSYSLTVEDNVFTRQQLNTPEITIYFHEVKEIIKNKEGGFIIKGLEATDTILIPVQVDNYAALETLLNQVKPVIPAPASVSALRKLAPFISLIAVALFVVLYTSNNKIIVGICGVLSLSLLGWNFYYMSRSKNIDKKTKNSRWVFLLVMISVIAVMIMKLTAVPE